MRKRIILIIFLCSQGLSAYPQISALKGKVTDENGTALSYAPVVLMNPADSTMAFFGVTNEQGIYEIKGIKAGQYMLQAILMGHQSYFRKISVPTGPEDDPGTIVLKSIPVTLGEVVVSDERTPLKFKRDTIEYNTAAFVTKPDAVVEDLLKKLPGLEVDRAGNIKAMGEDIKKVLVDGREFFGNDPKLATRNVPADALRKVQVYDKKSDESEFTGIDDGTRDKTLNLLLKEDKKNAIFGELLAGSGNDFYYQGSAKVYRFTDKNQFAALGMINNINQFGFSFKDYIDFNGGLQSLGGHGGEVQIRIPSGSSGSFPINFGQPVTGLSTSGAAGINFSRVYKKDSRYFMSYIANGSDRDLDQTTSSRNFTGSGSFQQTDSLKEMKNDRVQRLNFGLRNRIDSTQNLIINGTASLSSGITGNRSGSVVYNNSSRQNTLGSTRDDKANRFTGTLGGSYTRLINKGKTVFRLSSDGSLTKDIGNSSWITDTYMFDPAASLINSQFQENSSGFVTFYAGSSLTMKIAKLTYIEPEIKGGAETETLKRIQGIPSDVNIGIDSLSPDFTRRYQWIRPGVKIIRNTNKTMFSFGLLAEIGRTSNSLNDDFMVKRDHVFFTPDLSIEYEYRTGRRIRAYFQTNVNVPSVSQLLPVVNNSNPLVLSSGNRALRPEISNSLTLNWWIFDQFSFTSLLTNINASYTRDKINWSRSVSNNLIQSMSLTNVPDDYILRGDASFSTPIRSLGIKISSDIAESWNRGISYVDGEENINTNFSHKASLSLENRNKAKFDIRAGGSFQLTNARFSIQESLNNRFIDFSYFTEIRYNPDKHWNFQMTCEVTSYSSKSFYKGVTIPLAGAEISYYFLKNYRGSLCLQGSDLLNRNTGIQRSGELNYIREQRSNMLGRFFMLSFKYKLNKFAGSKGDIDVKIRKI